MVTPTHCKRVHIVVLVVPKRVGVSAHTFYGAPHVLHMQNTYESGAWLRNVALHPKPMKLQETDNSIAFLALKDP